jgi:glucosamine--fructose-6-phosphate aminotransferase (isomerizing)
LETLRPRISTLLTEARRIVLVGTGASLAVIRIAAPIWRHAAPGAQIVVRQSAEAALGDLDGAPVVDSDLVVAISQSGSSPETLAAARLARRTGASVLALTAHEGSALASAATLSITLASGEEMGAATKSALASLAALLAIAGALPSDAGGSVRLRDELILTKAWTDAAQLGARLASARHSWMLGFGAAEGFAEAGSLLWHEKVVRPAIAATPSEFRHGLIEAAGREDAVVLITMPGVEAGAEAYVERLRAELETLGVDAVELRSTAAEPGPAALELLFRIQQLARATALAGGTYREEFAILRHVVKPASDLLG